MNIILLSGGSGKRLWPLSNDARSKQFLQLLEKPDGGMESMVQRVVRQVTEAGLTQDITIATNAVQREIIISQLGERLDVVTEPQRRDTFPAIALASSYLALEKKLKSDEIVVVMPCDPYTEDAYFQTIGRMVKAVEAGRADLVLMGITPTYPSSKFGYVVPEQGSDDGLALTVKRFTEKPTEDKAVELLSQGAFWNGGVFAFRLGYMMDIAEKYVKAATFAEVHARYAEFPKISFDYEVAEKAASVAVVPFKGEWKDLGTWNALTGELKRNALGNATVGPACENVHAINELGLPVFVNGVKDVVVAASPDGILVCGKDNCEDLKSHVAGLATRPMYEERRWGTYRVLDQTTYPDGTKSLTKFITLKAGKSISYQIHRHRSEVWTFVDGEGQFVLDGQVRRVGRGDVANIPCEHLHSVRAVSDLSFIEVQTGNPLVEDDIERFDYDWK